MDYQSFMTKGTQSAINFSVQNITDSKTVMMKTDINAVCLLQCKNKYFTIIRDHFIRIFF